LKSPPHILLVNPWIHDFAAYDFWAKPLGLLIIGAILRLQGFRVSYADCQDRFHPKSLKRQSPEARNGRGPYLKTPIPPPKGLESTGRTYSRYGIPPEWLAEDLKKLPVPDAVLVTCLMTYWYPGAFETIRAVRKVFPKSPIVLGGIYATLCADHAKAHSGADHVLAGPGEAAILDLMESITGFRSPLTFDPEDLNSHPFPAFDLQGKMGYAPLLTSRGCPYACDYCASKILMPRFLRMSPDRVVAEIFYWQDRFGVKNFAFYDDALLVDAGNHAIPIFEKLMASNRTFFFHTPNAVHIREITPKIAGLMRAAGVKTLRLGLETSDFSNREMDQKVVEADFVQAVHYLLEAGFQKDQVGVYLLAGLPGQSEESVARSIKTVKQSGITPILAYYTPIPGTRMWEAAKAASRYDLSADPVFTNNAVMPCQTSSFDWETLARLKRLVKSG
jgi:radical SAM superfamily enzyme YgiQ (UPF0313 family)